VGLPKEVKEEFLHKVLGFGGIAEDSLSNAVDQTGIATEKKTEGLRIGGAHPGNERFVGGFFRRRNRILI
jgi:hypothetical protein